MNGCETWIIHWNSWHRTWSKCDVACQVERVAIKNRNLSSLNVNSINQLMIHQTLKMAHWFPSKCATNSVRCSRITVHKNHDIYFIHFCVPTAWLCSDESFPDWSWKRILVSSDFLKVAGFGQACPNMHLLGGYGGKFGIFRTFSGFWPVDHFHHCYGAGGHILGHEHAVRIWMNIVLVFRQETCIHSKTYE